MRYVVNRRGRAIEVQDREAENLISLGYLEITKDQFGQGQYYPQWDNGPGTKSQTTSIPTNQILSPKQTKERERFATVAV